MVDFRELSGCDDLTKLEEYLAECAEMYLGQDLPSQRVAVANALAGVAKFLEANQFRPDLILLILRPVMAIVERENNSLDLMFSERARGGRPKNTGAEHIRNGILAGFANRWLQLHEHDGRTQDVKLSEAARQMRGPWFGELDRGKLQTAREIVSQEAKDHLAVESAAWFGRFYEKLVSFVGDARAFPLMVRYFNEHPAGQTMGISKTPTVSPSEEG